MAYDYAPAVAFAKRMIARYGRTVALRAASEGPADPNRPLAGPAPAPAPVTGIPAAFVEPSSLQSLGMTIGLASLFLTYTKIAIIAPGDIYFGKMQFLIDSDDNIEYKIDRISEFKPGSTILLYYMGLSLP